MVNNLSRIMPISSTMRVKGVDYRGSRRDQRKEREKSINGDEKDTKKNQPGNVSKSLLKDDGKKLRKDTPGTEIDILA